MIKFVGEQGSMMQDRQRAHMIAASLIPAQVSQGAELMCIYHQQNIEERTNGAWKLQIPFKVDVQSAKQKQYKCSVCINSQPSSDKAWLCHTKTGKLCFPQRMSDKHSPE